jgi:hypothetical protein
MILPAACSAIMTQITTLYSPVLALSAVRNPWILDTTLDERRNNLSLLQCLDACHVHLNTIVKLTVWLHGGRSGLTPELTDCRRERALPANASSEESGASKLQRLAAVRCSDLVRQCPSSHIPSMPRNTPPSSTSPANSSNPMLAIERLLSICENTAATARNWRPRSSSKSTTRSG